MKLPKPELDHALSTEVLAIAMLRLLWLPSGKKAARALSILRKQYQNDHPIAATVVGRLRIGRPRGRTSAALQGPLSLLLAKAHLWLKQDYWELGELLGRRRADDPKWDPTCWRWVERRVKAGTQILKKHPKDAIKAERLRLADPREQKNLLTEIRLSSAFLS